jgi:hypothetical protein
VDRPFHVGKSPKMYVFAKPKLQQPIPRKFQICCRHELHVVLPPSGVRMDGSSFALNDFVEGNAVERIIQEIVPDGVRVEVPVRVVLDPMESRKPTNDNDDYDSSMAVYLVVYCGEQKAITRVNADGYRAMAEEAVSNHLPLRQNRVGRMVSRPFPYPLLDSLIKEQPT